MVVNQDPRALALLGMFAVLYVGQLYQLIKQFYVKSSYPVWLTRIIYVANNMVILALIIDTSVYPFVSDMRYLFYCLTVTVISQLALMHYNFFYHKESRVEVAEALHVRWERVEITAEYLAANRQKLSQAPDALKYLERLVETAERTERFHAFFGETVNESEQAAQDDAAEN